MEDYIADDNDRGDGLGIGEMGMGSGFGEGDFGEGMGIDMDFASKSDCGLRAERSDMGTGLFWELVERRTSHTHVRRRARNDKKISRKCQLTHLPQRPLLPPLYHNTRTPVLRLVTVSQMLLQAVVSIHPLYLPVEG